MGASRGRPRPKTGSVEFGAAVKGLLDAEKLSPEAFGLKIGVSGKLVRDWIDGTSIPSTENFLKVAGHFRVVPQDLLEGRINPINLPPGQLTPESAILRMRQHLEALEVMLGARRAGGVEAAREVAAAPPPADRATG